MNFSKIELSENLKETLGGCFDSGRLMHAIILEGSNAEKRLEASWFLAQSLVCTEKENRFKPCGCCPDCIKALSHSHCDIKLTEGTNKSKMISVEDIRKIRTDVFVVPNEAERKVYIIRDAHKMNETAQNAFLKVLEEPPAYVNFILECEDKATLLETVRSRCSSFRLGELDDSSTTKKKLENAVEDALKITNALTKSEECEMMKVLGKFEKDKEGLLLCLNETALIVRDALVIKNGADSFVSTQQDEAYRLAGHLTSAKLISVLETTDEIIREMQYNASNNLLLTRLCYMLKGG